MAESAVRELDVARKLKRRTKVVDLAGTIQSIEEAQPPINSVLEAEIAIA